MVEPETKAAPPVPSPAPAVRMVYLAGAGGQEAVDLCIGPVHFTPVTEYFSVAEHDSCGGWERFSDLQTGDHVTISGLGSYTVSDRGTVPKGGTTNDVLAVLGRFPAVALQTCIPGTNRMLVIGLSA